MLDMIQTVLGAVATKDIVPVLTHIHVTPTGVQGSNGRLSINCPGETPVDRALCLPGRKLQQALKRGRKAKWSTTDQSLTLTAGKLRVRLPINPAPFPVTEPSTGEKCFVKDPEGLVQTLRMLKPFVAKDGSKPWACGVFIKGDHIYTTNNVILVRTHWEGVTTGDGLPPVNVPLDAVDEVLRLTKDGHEVEALSGDATSLTFHFNSGVWLRTSLLQNDWPEADGMLDGDPVGDGYGVALPELREGVDAVVPFSADERAPVVEVGEFGMRTREGDVQASVDLDPLPEGHYRAEALSLVLSVAEAVYFEDYPNPVHFTGGNGELKGIFVGVRA